MKRTMKKNPLSLKGRRAQQLEKKPQSLNNIAKLLSISWKLNINSLFSDVLCLILTDNKSKCYRMPYLNRNNCYTIISHGENVSKQLPLCLNVIIFLSLET